MSNILEIKSFEWFEHDNLRAIVKYTGTNQAVRLVDYVKFTDYPFYLPFLGQIEEHSLYTLFASRVCPKHRCFQHILRDEYKVEYYNPELMCRTTHGVTPQDYFWMRFNDESKTITWRDVTIRN